MTQHVIGDAAKVQAHVHRSAFLRRIYATIKDVPGNVVECGVQYGYSLGMLAALIQQEGQGRHLYGFDAWGHLGQEQPLSEIVPTVPWETAFHAINTALAASFIEPSQVHLVKGWFAKTLPNTDTGTLALVHLDCDAEESYRVALDTLWPRLQVGGKIILDEYGSDRWLGAKAAVETWIARVANQWKGYLCEDTRWYLVKVA